MWIWYRTKEFKGPYRKSQEPKNTKRIFIAWACIAILIVMLVCGRWILFVVLYIMSPHSSQENQGIICVRFKDNVTTKEDVEHIVAKYNCTIDEFLTSRPPYMVFVRVPEGQEKEYVRTFEGDPNVKSAYIPLKCE